MAIFCSAWSKSKTTGLVWPKEEHYRPICYSFVQLFVDCEVFCIVIFRASFLPILGGLDYIVIFPMATLTAWFAHLVGRGLWRQFCLSSNFSQV